MMGHIAQIKSHLQDYIPFMLTASGSQPSFSVVRIIEALIIAVLTAFGAGYVTQQVMQNELKHISIDIQRNEKNIEKVDDRLREHLMKDYNKARP